MSLQKDKVLTVTHTHTLNDALETDQPFPEADQKREQLRASDSNKINIGSIQEPQLFSHQPETSWRLHCGVKLQVFDAARRRSVQNTRTQLPHLAAVTTRHQQPQLIFRHTDWTHWLCPLHLCPSLLFSTLSSSLLDSPPPWLLVSSPCSFQPFCPSFSPHERVSDQGCKSTPVTD